MSLETLPQELQIEIFSQSPEISIIGQQLSKTLQPIANEVCMKTIGLNPISQTEVKNYFKTIPKMVGCIPGDVKNGCFSASIFMFQDCGSRDYEPVWIATNICPTFENIADNKTTIEMYYFNPEHSGDESCCIVHDIRDKPRLETYDILTTYRILKRRKGCMEIDPQYAKKRALEIFDEICSRNDGLNLIYLHLYLIIHIWILNLDIQMKRYEVTYDSKTKTFDNVVAIVNDNKILIEKIRQHLLIQD